MWTRYRIIGELVALAVAVPFVLLLPDIGTMLAFGYALTILSPYKIVVTSSSLEVKDLVNMFGWKVSLRRIQG